MNEKEKDCKPGGAPIPLPTALTYASFRVHNFKNRAFLSSPGGTAASHSHVLISMF